MSQIESISNWLRKLCEVWKRLCATLPGRSEMRQRLREFFRDEHETKNRLFDCTKTTIEGLLPKKTAKGSLKEAEKLIEEYDPNKRWVVWRSLIQMHRASHEQVSKLEACMKWVRQAELLKLKRSERDKFLGLFGSRGKHSEDLGGLSKAIRNEIAMWGKVKEKIKEIRPPVFFAHAFLRISGISGIETASLFVGGLIALGAIHMAFFYQAAVANNASAYWTLEDLMNHGILVIPYIFIMLILIEVWFVLYQERIRMLAQGEQINASNASDQTSGKYSDTSHHREEQSVGTGTVSRYRLHGAVLKRPVLLVSAFFVATALFVSVMGHARGNRVFEEFLAMDKKSTQMATVLDGTVLQYVFLVGTSDRTAIFLRPNIGYTSDLSKKFAEWRNEVSKFLAQPNSRDALNRITRYSRTFVEVSSHVFSAFAGRENRDRNGASSNAGSPSEHEKLSNFYNVLVMDRALIVCHGKLDECPLPSPTNERDRNQDGLPVPFPIPLKKQLSEQLRVLEESLGSQHDKVIEGQNSVQEHMDRHYCKTIIGISEIGQHASQFSELRKRPSGESVRLDQLVDECMNKLRGA